MLGLAKETLATDKAWLEERNAKLADAQAKPLILFKNCSAREPFGDAQLSRDGR